MSGTDARQIVYVYQRSQTRQTARVLVVPILATRKEILALCNQPEDAQFDITVITNNESTIEQFAALSILMGPNTADHFVVNLLLNANFRPTI